jgi:thymidylate synthase ThyX
MARVNLKEIGDFPDVSYARESRRTIEEVLKPVDISFSVEGVSRATTHEICESNDSFTQQSMRYVKMGEGAFIIPPTFSESLKQEFAKTMNFLLDNYSKLSEIKDEFKDAKGRPNASWFKFAPIEDNRYALSLATPSNILVTLDGSKLLNFFGSLSEGFESRQIFDSLQPNLPNDLADLCLAEIGSKDFEAIELAHRDKLDLALEQVYVNIRGGRFERAGLGALTSTNAKTPSELLKIYDQQVNTREKLTAVAKRVLGYGHESIVEHVKSGAGLGMSLVTYHQFQRHRVPTNVREDFRGIPFDRRVIVPPRIAQSEEGSEIFESGISAARNLREKIMQESPEYNHFALPNGTLLGVYSNMNARAFFHIANERLCNNAQWEIQGLMTGLALQLREAEPELYAASAPKCITQGSCPEGKLTCGKLKEVRDKYGVKD